MDYYLSKFSKEQVTTIWKKLRKEVAINEKVQTLRSGLSEHELINIIHTASSNCREQILISNFYKSSSRTPKTESRQVV